MNRYKKTEWTGQALVGVLKDFCSNHLPTAKDNLKQLAVKIGFILAATVILISGIYFGSYYYIEARDNLCISADRRIFSSNSTEKAQEELHRENYDYRGWISIKGTELDNPIFKTDNNSFYLAHNAKKQKSENGALFLDYRSSLKDKNTVIYGNSPDNGSLFTTLQSLKELSFYNENSVIRLTSGAKTVKYKVFAVMVLNSAKSQDGGYIYNIYRNEFWNDEDFASWVELASERSIINSNIDVSMEDKILTLVTECDDFEDARLVVMARTVRKGETFEDVKAVTNPKPRYPKEWYKVRNIKYPF